MSKRFKNKTPTQCRNHFKNILLKFGDIENYVGWFESQFKVFKLQEKAQDEVAQIMESSKQEETEGNNERLETEENSIILNFKPFLYQEN